MDKPQEEIYMFLFRVWKIEATSNKIGNIKDKENFLKEIQFLISKIKESIEKSEKKEKVIKRIQEKTLENILYMVKDFYEIRSEKILKLCRSLQKIDEDVLFPVEQDYYKQLFAAFKGDSNTKKYLLASIENNHTIPNKEIFEKEITHKNIDQVNSNSIDIAETIDLVVKKENIEIQTNQTVKKNKDIEYILIRFTKNIPALVGKDLKIYGPFQTEEIVRLPAQNALILIEENCAIKINPES